ncbi:MAG: hypothetical protein ACFFFB_07645 [Candidatus Heimdallarchaeota archaeon]
MKKSHYIMGFIILFGISLAIIPPAIPQIGVYTFHGAAGNTKILKVRVADGSSLADLFGADYTTDLESFFGTGCLVVGAQKKSLVTEVNFTAKFDASTETFPVFGLPLMDITLYNTSNWDWTTGAFSGTPDSVGDIVRSFYDPTNLTTYINTFYTTYFATPYNISTHTAGAYLAQLPTSVAQYLGALVWEPGWENFDNTIRHTALAGSFIFGTGVQYEENCTETWTYDETYGAWIGYKIEDNETNVIYEFSIELPTAAMIPGYELSIFLGVSISLIVGLIYVITKRKQ